MSPSTFETILNAVLVTDGLDLRAACERYAKRRKKFLESCSALTVIGGITSDRSQGYSWLQADIPLYQDPETLFLTGLNQNDVALLCDPFTNRSILFLPAYNAQKTFWEGHQLSFSNDNAADLATQLGVDEVCDIQNLEQVIAQNLGSTTTTEIATFWHEPPANQAPKTPLHNAHNAFKTRIEAFIATQAKPLTLKNCESLLTHRLCLDERDQKNLEEANTITSEVFKRCCAELSSFKTETEIAGLIKGEMTRASAFGESFPAIVACGDQAAILHYWQHNQALEPGRLLLLDFGCRLHSTPADISRTIPVNGRFNPLQRLLYNIVLEAQKKVESMTKPGITISELNSACWTYIEDALQQRFFSQGGTAERPYTSQPHNVSHLIAHCVHDGDPHRKYRDMPLEPGMVISNEPGLYGTFNLKIDSKTHSETLGIRIEDNLLLTSTSCKNLSCSCPKEIDEIESLLYASN